MAQPPAAGSNSIASATSRSDDKTHDLVAAARELMVEHGFEPAFPQPVQQEVAALAAGVLAQNDAGVRDLRAFLWSSIDNRESRDLDQIEYAEKLSDGTIRLYVAIADVDALVPLGSATDAHAARNTTSVYTGVSVFPMLPPRLSFDLTSLNEHADRVALVVELDVNTDGAIARSDVFRALVRNQAKLDYATVGPWLENVAAPPAQVANNAQLEEQLRWQDEAAQCLRTTRREAGALNFETIEARPVVAGGKVIDITVVPSNRARDLIENFMVSANVAMAQFLMTRKVPALRRVVRTPRRWDRIVEIAAEMGDTLPAEPDPRALSAFLEKRKAVDAANFADLSLMVVKLLGAGEYVLERRLGDRRGEGHFGLAVAEYTHSTAPNRRYPDLIIQRLAKSALSSAAAPYTDAELIALALHCTEQEDAARKVERAMRKKAAAALLEGRIGESFAAIVTGASNKGTYVRVLRPPVEGRLVRGTEGLDVGMTVRVQLARVNFERGYIDFETESGKRAYKLERSKRKKAAAARLVGRVGETFNAVVTGASEQAVYVRTADGIEGRLMRGSRGLHEGDPLQVTLIGTDAVHGFIDFARVTPENASKAQRVARKRAAAIQLQGRIGEKFAAEITGITRKATWVRTDSGIEGRLVRGWRGLKLGDPVQIVLLAVESGRGYIDFARTREPEISNHVPPGTRPALEYLAAELQKLPGLAPIGLYVVGSAAMGDYQPWKSDLDFVAVTAVPVGDDQIQLLTRLHRNLSRRFPEHFSGKYVTRDALARRDESLEQFVGFDNGRTMPKGMARLNEVCRYEMATNAVPIFGPDPREFTAPVDEVALQRFVRANMQSYWTEWVRKAEGADLVQFLTVALLGMRVEWGVLGVSRQFFTLREGGVISKTAGGRYALDHVPPEYHRILREAIRIRTRTGPREFRNPWSRRNAALAYMRHVFDASFGT